MTLKQKIKKVVEDNFIEDIPDLILELFEEEKQKWIEEDKDCIDGLKMTITGLEMALNTLKDAKWDNQTIK